MAKTAKPKNTTVSKHSRAARRAASPSLDVDKSITSLPRVEPDTSTSSFFSAQHNSGVSKKSKAKPKTRAQKRRAAKGMERAEMVMDRTEVKVAKSEARGKRVKARRAAWEDLNGQKRKLEDASVDQMETSDQEDQPATSAPVSFSATPSMPASNEQVDADEDDEIT